MNAAGRQEEQALPELPDRGENQLARDERAIAAPAVTNVRHERAARDANAARRRIVAEGEAAVLADDTDDARLPLEPRDLNAGRQEEQVLPELPDRGENQPARDGRAISSPRAAAARIERVVANRRARAVQYNAAIERFLAEPHAAAPAGDINNARLPLEPALNAAVRQEEQPLPELPDRGENQLVRDGQANAVPAVIAAQDKHAAPEANAVALAADTINSNHSSQAETTPDTPVSPFSRLNFDQKIQALLDAVDNQINQAADYEASFLDLVTTQIGRRNLTAKECLGFALEIALEKRRAQVPDISLRLTRILNAEDQTIPLFGVNFPRTRIEEWSREESLPEPIQVHREFIAKDNELKREGAGSVHSDPVQAVGRRQLYVMKARTAIGSQKTVEKTATEIRKYIATLSSSGFALVGLNRIMKYAGGMFNDDSSPVLATVWGYIEQSSNQEMKQNLRDAMIRTLAEIGENNPCSTGIIERLIEVPTAIDFSLPQKIDEEEVLRELAQMAGVVNEHFEVTYAFNCTGARAEAGDDEESETRIAVEASISNLKRDMFLEKARIELVMLRNIDSNFVMTTADKVFPKGTIL